MWLRTCSCGKNSKATSFKSCMIKNFHVKHYFLQLNNYERNKINKEKREFLVLRAFPHLIIGPWGFSNHHAQAAQGFLP